MQKSFIAIALALTLTSAFAAYTPTGASYSKAPISLGVDGSTNFTNMTGPLQLASITIGDVYLVSGNLTLNQNNNSASNWNLWYVKLDGKALTAAATNSTASIVAPQGIGYYNNFAVGFGYDNDTGVPQLRAYQVPLTGTGPARLQLSSNANASFSPAPVGAAVIGKTYYFFYLAAFQKLNVTNFVVGSATVGTPEFTVSTTFDTPLSFSVTWGEALGSNVVFASWIENAILKDSLIDVVKGNVLGVTTVGAYAAGYACSAYATDKKQFGELCQTRNMTTGIINYYVRTNASTSLVPLGNATLFVNNSALAGFYPYGPYLAILYVDTTATSGVNYAYDIWNLDTVTPFKNRTTYLNIDVNSTQTIFRVPSGGLYTLLYNNKQGGNPINGIQVGLLLGSSYLASVLGFLLTIIAGLFLF